MSDFLEIDVRVLLARYGRAKVLQVLARLNEQTVEELERQLETIQAKPRPKRTLHTIADLVGPAARERPEIAEFLRALAVGFENRTFLPQLRDVQRFLQRAGALRGKLKSRAAAVPIVARTLSGLPKETLEQLLADKSSSGSDYELLARAIMGPKPGGGPSGSLRPWPV